MSALRDDPVSLPGPSGPPRVGAGWATERLRLGMANVGFWVLAAIAGLALGFPDTGSPDLVVWTGTLGLYTLLQAPFDLIGGYWLPRRHRRPTPPLPVFIGRWARGVLAQATVMVISGLLLLELAETAGLLGAVLGGIFSMMMVVALQEQLFTLVTGTRAERVPEDWVGDLRHAGLSARDTLVVDTADPAFVGGWAGLPGRERLLVPRRWLTMLPTPALVAQLRRRAVARSTGERTRGVLLALVWNTVGFAGASWLVGLQSAADLVIIALAFTLWAFLGLLWLPTPSRSGVYAIDGAVRAAGTEPADVVAAMMRLDVLQEDEPTRPKLVETIFHPVPSMARRMGRLYEGGQPGPGAWHAARMALVMGWALGSPLSRAVHCNAGRPELWAMLPGD